MLSAESNHRRWIVAFAAGLMLIMALACQNTPTPTETWIPPYLQATVCEGVAVIRWAGASEWASLRGGDPIIVRDRGEIIAPDGARLCLGDGSKIELSPGARIELQSPGAFPLLDIVLQDGEIVLNAQKASYRVSTSVISVMLLEIPAQAQFRLNGEITQVRVQKGALNCKMGEEITTLTQCWEIRKQEGEAAYVGQFCASPTSTPTPTRAAPGPMATPTVPPASPTPTLSPTPPYIRRSPTPTPTPTLSPTPTPTAISPPPPPPQPPPPPTPPPPTPLPPTDTPLPPPTDTPERPTPTPDRGTPGP